MVSMKIQIVFCMWLNFYFFYFETSMQKIISLAPSLKCRFLCVSHPHPFSCLPDDLKNQCCTEMWMYHNQKKVGRCLLKIVKIKLFFSLFFFSQIDISCQCMYKNDRRNSGGTLRQKEKKNKKEKKGRTTATAVAKSCHQLPKVAIGFSNKR